MASNTNLVLPPIPAFPSEAIRKELGSEEWKSFLDYWIASLELRLKISDDLFSVFDAAELGTNFLTSYLLTVPSSIGADSDPKSTKLRHTCYTLIKKILRQYKGELDSSTCFDLMSSGSISFGHTKSWRILLKAMWTTQQKAVKKAIETAKSNLSAASLPSEQTRRLQMISALTKALPETATVTVAAADYLDTLTEIYGITNREVKIAITENVFVSFIALLQNKHVTILTDNMYHLKSESDRQRKSDLQSTTVLSSLICTTSFLKHFTSNVEIATHKRQLADQLNTYRSEVLHLHPPGPRLKRSKGKARAQQHDVMHTHRASQVSQVHELFPNLSTAYILKALDHFSNNVENVIAALLEPHSLPEPLRDQNIPDTDNYDNLDLSELEPRPTPPLVPEHNGIDEDQLDRLQISSAQIRRGKKDVTHQQLLVGDDHARSKAAILSALASFDSDDDERDDTYDVADVGGAVDNTLDSDERRQPDAEGKEAALFSCWKETPEVFARDSKTRASNTRRQLRDETSMSDEQIEGWAIILARDQKLQDRLSSKYSSAKSFSGQQKLLESTRWQPNASTENSEAESGPERSNDARRIGQAGIRGQRSFARGGHRGDGNAAGPSGNLSTQQARKRKEQGRGRGGANHRRDARAKKLGRGMGPLPQS